MVRNSIISAIFCLFLLGCATGEKEVSKAKKQADIYYNHGTLNLVSKKYTESLKYLRKAYNLSPGESRISNNLGMAYYFKGKPDKGVSFIKQALKLDKKNSDARNNLASIYFNQKKYDLAEQQYQAILQDLIYLHQYRTYNNLGLVYQRKGMNSAAVEHFKLAIQENPNYCPAYYHMGMVEFLRGDFNKAKLHFKDGIKGDCFNNAAPHYQLALTLLQKEDYTGAILELTTIGDKFGKTRYAALATAKLQDISKLGKNAPQKKLSKNELKYKMELIKDQLEEYDTPTF